MASVQRQVQAEWQMDVDRAGEERKDAEGEAHYEAEEVKIRPGHTAPRAHAVRWLESETLPSVLVLQRGGGRRMAAALMCVGPENLAETLGETRGAKNLRQKK